MKTGKSIIICIWAVIAIALTVILVLGVTGTGIFSNGFSFGTNFSYSNSGAYSVGNGTVEAGSVQTIEIHWVSGNVEIKEYDGTDIKFEEDEQSKDNYKLRYLVDREKLIIQFCKSGLLRSTKLNKSLTVYVPSSLQESLNIVRVSSVSANISVRSIKVNNIDIETVSGDTSIANLTASDISIDAVSGKVSTDNIECTSIDIENVSGGIDFKGSANNIDIDTVSGSAKLTLQNCPLIMDCESVSASFTIYLPENDGFTAQLETVSGNINCDLEVQMNKKRLSYKNGTAKFDFDTVSGNVTIYKYEA